MKVASRVVFDSRISKRVSDEDLRVIYKISNDELDLVTKLYQAYKIKNLTLAPTIEQFLKELVFMNMDLYKNACGYFEIYSEEHKE